MKSKLTMTLLACLILNGPLAGAAVISVNFQGRYSGSDATTANLLVESGNSATEIVGVNANDVWNDTDIGYNGQPAASNLRIYGPNFESALLSYSSLGAWGNNDTSDDANYSLMNGFFVKNASPAYEFSVSGMTGSFSTGYDVYLYVGAQSGKTGNTGTFTLSQEGATVDTKTYTGTLFAGTFTEATETTGNYLVFRNVTGDAFDVSYSGGEVGLCGFEVVGSLTNEVPDFTEQIIFQAGNDGYAAYRIPALIQATNGHLLAICEGRVNGTSDTGDIDTVLKRSTDNGLTWGALEVVWNDSANVCGNPCPVVDQSTGHIHLLSTWNLGHDTEHEIIGGTSDDTRRVYHCVSIDNGLTWSTPTEITSTTKQADWSWYATGPGSAMQIERGPNAGRLVIACDHVEEPANTRYSHAIYSDDHGVTWQLGGRSAVGVNECLAVELSGNRLMMNMRNYSSGVPRQTMLSADGGATWTDQQSNPFLPEPRCQAGFEASGWNPDGTREILLFSNPASSSSRIAMTVRRSWDEGNTWNDGFMVHAAASAYSDLQIQTDSNIGLLYERGATSPYETIAYARFPLDAVGTPPPPPPPETDPKELLLAMDEGIPGQAVSLIDGAIIDSTTNELNMTADAALNYIDGDATYGMNSRALAFTGTQRVRITDAKTYNRLDYAADDSFTMEMNVRIPNGSTQVGALLSKDVGSLQPSWWTRIDNGKIRFLISDGTNEPNLYSTSSINDGEWHHVAVVRDVTEDKLKVYIDGTLENSTTDTTTGGLANGNPVSIGGYNSGSRMFTGDIDFVRVTPSVLAPAAFLRPNRFERVIFNAGEDGYGAYRIPALITATNGHLLAFCEGRVNGTSDSGNIDTVLKRSTDHGNTWSALQVVWDDLGNVCGNPCPVVDQATGTIHLLSTWNKGNDSESEIINGTSDDTRRVYHIVSIDNGITWSTPLEITTQVKTASWTWYATGPGSAIQIERGPNAGRMVIPCDHIDASGAYLSHAIYSNDHGATWQLGADVPSADVNECLAVELSGNRLMMNMRNSLSGVKRQTALSDDGGATWYGQAPNLYLPEPRCQAGFEAGGWNPDGTREIMLFSNPATSSSRTRMTVRRSWDEGETWNSGLLIHSAAAAYSDLEIQQDGNIGLFYERGDSSPYESIAYTRFSLDLVGAPPPPPADPVGVYWEMNEELPGVAVSLSAGAILDSSTNAIHATAENAMNYATGDARYGNQSSALAFTGTQRVRISDTDSGNKLDFSVDTSFTLEALVRVPNGSTQTGSILAKDVDSNMPSWWIRVESGRVRFLVADGNSHEPNLYATTTINDGAWHHVAAVRDVAADELKIYIDGVLENSIPDTTDRDLANDNPVTIGGYNAGNRLFTGDVDFVRITPTALTPSQFIQTYDADLDGMPDTYEIANNLDPNDDGSTDPENGAAGDKDSDGVVNRDEYIAGTGADSSLSYLKVEYLQVNSSVDEWTISAQTVSGRVYYIEGKTNLTDMDSWQTLGTHAGNNLIQNWTFSDSNQMELFRLRVELSE